MTLKQYSYYAWEVLLKTGGGVSRGYCSMANMCIWLTLRPIGLLTVMSCIFFSHLLAAGPHDLWVCDATCWLRLAGASLSMILLISIGPVIALLMPSALDFQRRAQVAAVVSISAAVSITLSFVEDTEGVPFIYELFKFSAIASLTAIAGIYLLVRVYRKEVDERFNEILDLAYRTTVRDLNDLQLMLPKEVRGELLTLSIEDKYLTVKTRKGTCSILMPMNKAVEIIDQDQGIRIHRNYWVNCKILLDIKYENGNPIVLLENGDWLRARREVVPKIKQALLQAQKV